MVDPMDDIARQAHQGSVSAIIQILNEKLATSGVRTRAMFDQGVLQLLCEAQTLEQLEQPVLVSQVRQILESLQPRNVKRVNINSRIVREQQLLWLEEINRDPQNQLLWSEEITLAKPGLLQRLSQNRKDIRADTSRVNLPTASPRLRREKKVFWRGLVGGASLSLLLLLLGWALYRWLMPQTTRTATTGSEPAVQSPSPGSTATPQANTAPADPFAEAVRLAERTVKAGQGARTSAEWLAVASQWQQASDLMAQVTAQDSRYATAQDRVQLYRQNREAALAEAQKSQ